MGLYCENRGHATRWMFANGVFLDAASTDKRGHHYVWRVHCGSYVDDMLEQVVAGTASRVILRHCRSHATAIEMNVATGIRCSTVYGRSYMPCGRLWYQRNSGASCDDCCCSGKCIGFGSVRKPAGTRLQCRLRLRNSDTAAHDLSASTSILETVDRVVFCTGPEKNIARSPLMGNLLEAGYRTRTIG